MLYIVKSTIIVHFRYSFEFFILNFRNKYSTLKILIRYLKNYVSKEKPRIFKVMFTLLINYILLAQLTK